MKVTARIYDIIKSELVTSGYNEYYNSNQLTFFDHTFSITRKILKFDSDVESVVNDFIFIDLKLDNPEHDTLFKKTFINRFLNRQIKYQTLESFNAIIVATFLENKDYLNKIYMLEDYIQGKRVNDSINKGENISDNRYVNSTLPQTQVNVDVNKDLLEFADSNSISKTKNSNKGDSNTVSIEYNLDNVLKIKGLLEGIMLEFDYKCFSQLW